MARISNNGDQHVDDPLWLTHMKSNREAFSNWLEWLVAAEADIMSDIRAHIRKDDFNAVKLAEGEMQALDKLRGLSTINDKEKSDFAEFQRLQGGISK